MLRTEKTTATLEGGRVFTQQRIASFSSIAFPFHFQMFFSPTHLTIIVFIVRI